MSKKNGKLSITSKKDQMIAAAKEMMSNPPKSKTTFEVLCEISEVIVGSYKAGHSYQAISKSFSVAAGQPISATIIRKVIDKALGRQPQGKAKPSAPATTAAGAVKTSSTPTTTKSNSPKAA